MQALEKMTAIVRSDTPDLELERLWQEGDIEGAHKHVMRLLSDARNNEPSTE